MKITIFLIVILMCTSSICVAEEGERTGNQLLKYCKNAMAAIESRNHEEFSAGYCIGYVDGIDEMTNMINITREPSKRAFCRPENATTRQIVRVVYKYLEDHPEELHEDAYFLAIKALQNAFPCKKK